MLTLMKRNRKQLFIVSLLVIFLVLLASAVYQSDLQLFGSIFEMGEDKAAFYFMWAVISICLLLCTKKDSNMIIWYVFLAIFGVVLIVGDLSYSPIDEGGHLDYINYISTEHRLPTMMQEVDSRCLNENIISMPRYEAVQMPLYYVIMAAAAGGIKSWTIRFCVIRFFGLLCLFATLICVRKIIDLLKCGNMIVNRENEINAVVLLFSLNPGILVRFVRVSNEPLAVLFSAVIFYLAVKILLSGMERRLVCLCLFFSVLLFYTKSTGAFCISALLLVLLYYKKWRYFFGSIAVYVLCAVPWFVHCYKLYGTLTGMNKHMEIMLPMVNPGLDEYNLVTGIYKIFSMGFFEANEVSVGGIFSHGILQAVNLVVILTIAAAVIWSVLEVCNWVFIRCLNLSYTHEEKEKAVIILAAGMAGCDFMVLAAATKSTHIDALTGRYIYFIAVPVIILILKLLEKMALRRSVYIIMCVFYALAFLNTVIQYTGVIGEANGLWGKNYAEIECRSEIRNDKGEIMGVTLRKSYPNTADIVGKILVSNAGDNAVVHSISKEKDDVCLLFEFPVKKFSAAGKAVVYDSLVESIRDYNSVMGEWVQAAPNENWSQTFVWNGGPINYVELLTATFCEVQEGIIKVNILDENGVCIQSACKDMKYCVDNDWVSIGFYGVDSINPGKYTMEIAAIPEEGSALAFYTSNGDVYADGGLSIDYEDTGLDINFKIGTE